MSDVQPRKRWMPEGADVLGILGLGLLSVGSWMAYRPAGLIVPGLILFTLAALRTFVRRAPRE